MAKQTVRGVQEQYGEACLLDQGAVFRLNGIPVHSAVHSQCLRAIGCRPLEGSLKRHL